MVRVWAEEMCQNNDWLARPGWRSAGASASAGRHRVPRPARLRTACTSSTTARPTAIRYTWKLFERLVQATPDPDPVRNAGAATDPARHHQGNPRRARAARATGRIAVKARKAVVLTCGGFENNQEMIRDYLPGVPYCYTSGSPYNEGDGITMAMSVGADLWHMNNYAGPVDGAEGAGSAHHRSRCRRCTTARRRRAA